MTKTSPSLDNLLDTIEKGLKDIQKQIIPFKHVSQFSKFHAYKNGEINLSNATWEEFLDFSINLDTRWKNDLISNSNSSAYHVIQFVQKYPHFYTIEETKNEVAFKNYEKLRDEDRTHKFKMAIDYIVYTLWYNKILTGEETEKQILIELLELSNQNKLDYIHVWIKTIHSFVNIYQLIKNND